MRLLTTAAGLRRGMGFAAILLGLAACQAGPSGPVPTKTAQAVSPQPTAAALRPGLAVQYLRITANDVGEVEEAGRGRPGPALMHLNWNTTEEPVLTSAENESIGARIEGLIHLEKPGTYRFRARSNDGVRLLIGGAFVLEDPGVHAARWSDIGVVEIATPGWYPFYMVYFQKRGTASLELHWQPPGASNWVLVPGPVLAHTGK